MTTHPARWASEDAVDGGLGGSLTGALAPLPPAGRLPFAAMAGQHATLAPYDWHDESRYAPGAAADAATADRSAGFATFPLANAADAPGTARRLTRNTLQGWGLETLVDDASVIVSELVTNALRYGQPATAGHRPLPPASAEQPFLLSLVHHGGTVLCAVFDPGRDVPQLREPDYLRESGRGLHVLQSLSESWGWTTPDRHGKAVWAVIHQAAGGGAAGEDSARHDEVPVGPVDAECEPLSRLLLLLELLSGPSWLKALGASARPAHPTEVTGR